MIEKIKLGMWDLFAYLLPGTVIVSSVIIHCLLTGVLKISSLSTVPSTLLGIFVLLIVVIIGLLFEPIANLGSKLSTLIKNRPSLCTFNTESFSLKSWRRSSIVPLEKKAKELALLKEDENLYQYCKSWLYLKGNPDEFVSFLGKFGFYRNMKFISIINAIACLCLYSKSSLIYSIPSLIILAWIYGYRSKVFEMHQSITVYNQFIHNKSETVEAEDEK